MHFDGPGKRPPLQWHGRRIVALRGELHLTQDELARMLNIRPSTLRAWEDGHGEAVEWAVTRLDKLEKKLGKTQAMIEARSKSGNPTARTAETQPSEETEDQSASERTAIAGVRMQKAGLVHRLLHRLGHRAVRHRNLHPS